MNSYALLPRRRSIGFAVTPGEEPKRRRERARGKIEGAALIPKRNENRRVASLRKWNQKATRRSRDHADADRFDIEGELKAVPRNGRNDSVEIVGFNYRPTSKPITLLPSNAPAAQRNRPGIVVADKQGYSLVAFSEEIPE